MNFAPLLYRLVARLGLPASASSKLVRTQVELGVYTQPEYPDLIFIELRSFQSSCDLIAHVPKSEARVLSAILKEWAGE